MIKQSTDLSSIRTRIAPSPTGMPHVATLFQALIDYIFAKKHGGSFVVRIEDTDRTRFVEGAEDALFEAFDWLGVTPDESPRHGGEYGPYHQSERLDIYKKYADQLIETGKAYYCFCSSERLDEVRKEMQKQGKPPMYDRHCRDMDAADSKKKAGSLPHVIRMKIPDNLTIVLNDEIRGEISFESSTVDDQVIVKSDGFPTYHLAVVVDDYLMKISHIVRGEEWISSSPKHILLYEYFDWQMPKIVHTPLLRNPDRSKLSKRHGHAAFSWYRDRGYLKEAIVNFLASRVWNHPKGKEIYTIEELIEYFDFKHLHIQGPIVDLAKLNWINGQWLRQLTDDELINRLQPFKPSEMSDELLKKILPLIKERLVVLSDLENLTHFFYQRPKVGIEALKKESKMSVYETMVYLGKVKECLEVITYWSVETLESELRKLQEAEGIKPRPAFMTIRLALTGESATPPLFDVMEVLGKEEVLERLVGIDSRG